jgi:hypothetical protein
MIRFELRHPGATMEHLGYMPEMFDPRDPRPAKEQINANYAHGGGFHEFKGFNMAPTGLRYPGDPPMALIAEAQLPLSNETVRFYECSWVAIVQADGSYEVCRMD